MGGRYRPSAIRLPARLRLTATMREPTKCPTPAIAAEERGEPVSGGGSGLTRPRAEPSRPDRLPASSPPPYNEGPRSIRSLPMPPNPKQKLYCYVDETGQDDASPAFVVVAVVSAGDQEELREALMRIEGAAGTHHLKWHKTAALRLVTERGIGAGGTFFGTFPKPVPFFFPMLEVIENAISTAATPPYTARIFVDGIDGKKAAELTNALRMRGIQLEMVRSRRDESEPLIRLADMWAGCVRAAILGEASRTGTPVAGGRDGLHQEHKRKNPLRGVFFLCLSYPPAREANLCRTAGLRQDFSSNSSGFCQTPGTRRQIRSALQLFKQI